MQNVILKSTLLYLFLAIFSQTAFVFNILNFSFFVLIIFSLFSAIVTMIARQIDSKSLKKLDFWMVKKSASPRRTFGVHHLRFSSASSANHRPLMKMSAAARSAGEEETHHSHHCRCDEKNGHQQVHVPKSYHRLDCSSSKGNSWCSIRGRLFSEELSYDVILWCLSFLILCRGRVD